LGLVLLAQGNRQFKRETVLKIAEIRADKVKIAAEDSSFGVENWLNGQIFCRFS
jgi:hypothetical protein